MTENHLVDPSFIPPKTHWRRWWHQEGHLAKILENIPFYMPQSSNVRVCDGKWPFSDFFVGMEWNNNNHHYQVVQMDHCATPLPLTISDFYCIDSYRALASS